MPDTHLDRLIHAAFLVAIGAIFLWPLLKPASFLEMTQRWGIRPIPLPGGRAMQVVWIRLFAGLTTFFLVVLALNQLQQELR